jgi:hypothetical protein
MSAEFPVTNGGLADAFHAVNNEVIGFAHANNYGGPVTMMEVASLLAVTFGAVANQLVQATAYPATVVPVPATAEQATAMELVGYHYLKNNAPERLRTDTIVISRALLSDVNYTLARLMGTHAHAGALVAQVNDLLSQKAVDTADVTR